MARVFLEKYDAFCALGSNINEIFEKIENNISGIKHASFTFDSEKTFPIAAFPKQDLSRFPKEANLFQNICLYYIQNLIKASAISFSKPDTLLIISTTKGNIEALKENPEDASLCSLIPFFQKELNTANKPIIISNACISGVVAVNYAHDLIKTERYKNIVVCAADLISDFVVSGFNTFQAISPDRCQPYDENRKGVNLGEACAVALLSNKPNKIELLGGASSNDANHISGPSRDGGGLALAIKKSIKNSGVNSFDFINAHGTATVFNDEMECKAFNSLGLQNTPINSLKAYFGHTLGAAGLLELLICAESMMNKLAVASLGLDKKGLSANLNILKTNETININTILKTASGFGGCNAATIIRKNEE